MHRIWPPLVYVVLCFNLVLFAAVNEIEDVRKKALIFGITGQDGIYLSDFLLNKGYAVYGIKRMGQPSNSEVIPLLEKLVKRPNFFLHYGDLVDSDIKALLEFIEPDEIYNLAAQSHVQTSFEKPIYTAEVNAIGTIRILEAIREMMSKKEIKFYQASTSELFGATQESPQSENTPFTPCSPYGSAKLYGYWISSNYRNAYGIFVCNGILYNHESPLRPETYVIRKIILAACHYKLGFESVLELGNLNARRDWGYAKDYVEAMWLMLQQEKAEDYVIATGETHSVRECVEMVFDKLGIEIEWHEKGECEYGTDRATGKVIVKVNPHYYRPIEGEYLVGNNEKAKRLLEWKPRTTFSELLSLMIESDYQKVLNELAVK